jgi:FixJ family two-component response regulator
MIEPTVHVIDDDPSARRGLTRLIRAAGWRAEPFPSAADFLDSGKRDGPGCIVLDVQMPEMTGPELQEELCKSDYCMPIIFLSAHGNVPTTARTMKRGAVDFLTKPVDRGDLQDAIRAALALDAENRTKLAVRGPANEHVGNLTPREREVMRYVISGLLNKQIARELGIAEATVKLHRRHVMKKLGIGSVAIGSVAELVRLCERAGVAPAEPLM